MKTATVAALLTAVLACGLAFMGCPNGTNGNDDDINTFNVSFSGTAKWGDGRKLTAVVNTILDGAKTYAWTGIAGTNPGNQNEYTMVEDDENKTITCTVTIGDTSKAASVTVLPKWPNLSLSVNVIENRTGTRPDTDFTANGLLGDTAIVDGQPIGRTAITLISTVFNTIKMDDSGSNPKQKLETYPLKKIVITNGGNCTYSNGIMSLPDNVIWDEANFNAARNIVDVVFRSAIDAAVSFHNAKSQGIRLANAVAAPRMGMPGLFADYAAL